MSHRRLRAARAGLAALLVLGLAPGVAAARTAYVTNIFAGSVTPIDLATRPARPPITVGTGADGVAFTPDGATAFVANFFSNTVSRIDVASGTVTATLAVNGGPNALAVTPNGATVYVSTDSGTV